MSTPCNKFGTSSDVESMRRTAAKGARLQGDIGEQVAAEVVTNLLGYSAEFFEPQAKGIDSVFRDENGNLVLVEAKLTEKGLSSLDETKFGQQGSRDWVARQAFLMQNSPTHLDKPDNIKIGQEIDRIESQNIRMLVVATNPHTFESTVYERIGNAWVEIAHQPAQITKDGK